MKSIALSIAAALALSLVGCSEGPAERAGKEIDEAVEDTGEALEDAGDAIEETAEDAAKKAKQAVE